MLTIRQDNKSGHQTVMQATGVHYEPARGPERKRGAKRENPRGLLFAYGAIYGGTSDIGEQRLSFNAGMIYVFNDQGVIIAKYDLD